MVRESTVTGFYKRLRAAAQAAIGYPLQIFASTTDTDSLCALKIVTFIFANDGLRHSCYPVSSFGDILRLAGPKLSSKEEPLAVLLINCGCCRDLRRLYNLGPKVQVFVIDSHRPIHLHNLNDENRNVVVLYSAEDEKHADLAYDFNVSALANATDLDSDGEIEVESDTDGSSSESEDGEQRRIKRRRLNDNRNDDVDAHVDDDVAASVAESAAMKALKKLKSNYYRLGTYYGRPSGLVLYDMAYVTHNNTNELLWLACVSLTDQFVHERITNERYQAGVMELEQHVNSAGHLEMVTSVTLKDGTKVRAPDFCRITYEDEPRLMLLREWNLYESMECSSYVATKLKTWSESGIKRMKLLLAQMGIPLTECRQKFKYMSIDSKRRLKQEFEKFLPQYGLTELYYRGFERHHGYTSKVCAADVVYGLTALIESWTEDNEDSLADNFWLAYAALSLKCLEKLQNGMQLAIKVQKSIFRQGNLAMTRRGFLKSARGFRWLRLEDLVDIEVLSYPQALIRFCYFVMDALREKGSRMKPLVCASLIPRSTMALVVGVSHRPRLGAQYGNQFGIAFRAVAQELGQDFSHDAFESSWIRMDVKTVNAFMQRIAENL